MDKVWRSALLNFELRIADCYSAIRNSLPFPAMSAFSALSALFLESESLNKGSSGSSSSSGG
jgi:hypothetical protein